MNKEQVIQLARQQISEANLEQALTTLITFLQSEQRYHALHRAAIQALGQYRKIRQDEVAGIVSFDNAKLSYNQIMHSALQLLDQLETGATKPVGEAPTSKRLWVWGLAALLMAALIGIFVWQTLDRADSVAQQTSACPAFSAASAFNILLFRFQTFGDRSLNTHQAIRQRLGDFISNYGIPVEVGIYQDKGDDSALPTSLKAAESIAHTCQAHLVIMGSEEAGPTGNIITTRYRFLNLGEQFTFRRLRINERMEIDTLTSISSITTQGSITGNWEQAILLLFGIVAHETNNNEAAVQLLTQTAPADSASNLLKGMVLADTYLQLNQKDQALNSYNQVLEQHPNYGFALKNRATLLAAQGAYQEAAQDLTVHLDANPRDAEALEQRGVIYLEANRLEKAKADLEAALKLKPENTSILRQLRRLDVKTEEQLQLQNDADRRLRRNPADIEALSQKAEASKNLGDYRTAAQVTESILQLQPDNLEAHSIRIESFLELKQPRKAEEAIQQLKELGINKNELIKAAPLLRSIIRDSVRLQ